MPNIPEYTSQKGFQGLEPSDIGVSAFDEAGRRIAGQFTGAGEAIGRAVNAYGDADAMEDKASVGRNAVATMSSLNDSQNQAMAQADPNNPGAAAQKWHDDVFEPAMDKLEAGARTQQGRTMALQLRLQQEEYFGKKSVADGMTIAGAAVETNLQDSKNTLSAAVYKDPNFFDGAIQQFNTSLDAQLASHPNLSPEQLAKIRTEIVTTYHQQVAISAIKGLADNGHPEIAQQWLQSGKVDRYLDGPQEAEMNAYVGGHLAVQGNIAAQSLVDVGKQIRTTGDPQMYAQGQKIIAGIQEKTAAETASRRAAETKKLDESFAYGQVARGVMQAPAADLYKARSDLEGAYTSETDPEKLGVLNARRNAVDTAITDRDKQLKADPSKYALTWSPSVQLAYQKYQQAAPEDKAAAFNQLAQTSAAFQQIVNPGRPASFVIDDIRQQAKQAVASIRGPNGPSQAAGAMAQMAQTYARYWPQISAQLRKEKIFSGDEGVAARLYGNPESQALGETILNASAATGGERFGMHQIPEAKAMALADPALGKLRTSLANTGPAGVDFMNDYTAALAHAIQYSGDTAGVKTMAGKMVLDQFSFPSGMPTLRVPNGQQIDADRVADGARAVSRGIADHKLVVPPSYSGLSTLDQSINYAKQIAATGKWYTNENGTGALLYDEDGHNVQEMRNGKRVDVELTWDELGKVADKQPARATFKAAVGAFNRITGDK